LHTYQVKFRWPRTSLTWTDLSTFFGASERAAGKLVFTNCDHISAIAGQRDGFHCIRGLHLDALTPEELDRMLRHLLNKPARSTPPLPAPHQQEVLRQTLQALDTNQSTTCLMACGTGKTLIGLWTAERMKSKSILVLVPSLALIRQTMFEWERATSWPRWHRLVVCSDPTTVDRDSWQMSPQELEFPVSTNSKQVRRFLQAKADAVKVVFSTYHSAPVVRRAMKGLEGFDLAVFDEAHRTAGRSGLNFSYALHDRNVPAERRLFLTATPKHYDVTKRTRGGDAILVHSMDDPKVYGPVACDLPVARAVSASIICPYKVIVSVITGDQVNRELLRRGETVVNGDSVKAQWVANQLALADAIQRYGSCVLSPRNMVAVTCPRSVPSTPASAVGSTHRGS